MTFKTSFYGIPADVRANTVIPLLVGPPGADATVADGSITNAKLANVATATFKGRTTAGTGVPQDLTATQATALLNLADGSLKGLMSAADFTKLAGVASGATANTGTVTTVSVVTANGVSGSVTNAGTTPAITLTLGAITPTSIAASGQSLTGSDATSVVDLAATWNTTGAPSLIRANATDTASASTALLMRLQRNSSNVFTVRKDGYVQIDGTAASVAANSCGMATQGAGIFLAGTNTGSFQIGSSADTVLTRDAADTFAVRRGTNAQTFRISGTHTDVSNYRRVSIGMTTAGVGHIRPEGAGTGASGNVLHISGLPTTNPGPGILWNNLGAVSIGT